jgi:hypothetical protein
MLPRCGCSAVSARSCLVPTPGLTGYTESADAGAAGVDGRNGRLLELLLELREELRPLSAAKFVGDDLVVPDDQEPRRAALAGQLIEDRLEIAGPEARLVGLLELGRVDLDPRDLPVLRRSKPVGLVLVLPCGSRLAVQAADIDHLEGGRSSRRELQRAADQAGNDKGPTVHAGGHLVDDPVDQVLLVEPYEIDPARWTRRLEVRDGALKAGLLVAPQFLGFLYGHR